MKVIILAAGTGNRIKASHHHPKCLLRISGMSLLARYLKTLESFSISEILIVTGYKKEQIEDELEEINSCLNISLAINKDYQKGSALSFLLACRNIDIDDAVILMDADVLFHQEILNRLVHSKHQNVFLMDKNFEPGDEPVKLCVSQGNIIEFRKKLPENLAPDTTGESVGFFKFSENMFEKLYKHAESYIGMDRLDAPYEEVIRDVLLQDPGLFHYEDITGLPWIEIDFPEDITKAEMIINKINKQT